MPPIESAPQEPESPAPRRRRRGRLVIGGVVVVAVIAAAVVYITGRGGGPDHPSKWDPRVAELVTFVEKERDLRFEHPVEVLFMAPKSFEKTLQTDESTLTADDRKEIEDAAATLRALGLIGADVDLVKSTSDIQSTGTLAYYSFDDKKIRVRGTKLTPGVRVTVAHELTHVLQDQHFDLTRIQAQRDSENNDQAGDVLRGLAEGDAERIQNAYYDTLNDADRKEADAEEDTSSNSFEEDKYPAVLTALFGAPYALGSQLVSIIHTKKGASGIDAAFTKPPRFDHALLDPLGYLAGETGKTLATPTLAKTEKEVDHGGFGAFSLYLTLAQRLDLKKAMATADAWAGDSYVSYRSSGRVCVRVDFAGHDPGGTDLIATALAEWVAAGPAGGAEVKRAGGAVVLQACDVKGATTPNTNVKVDDLFALPVARAQIGELVLQQRGTIAQARCYAGAAVAAFTIEQLQADELPPAEMQRLQQIGESCRTAK